MSVTVYSMPNCVQCKNTYAFLDKYGVDYTTIDIKEDPSAMLILEKYNFQSAPVVVVENEDNEDAWCGFRGDKIKELAASRVPALA
jgi:glutaredoxin-like protein NrdH